MSLRKNIPINGPFSLPANSGIFELSCDTGTIWITIEGILEDLVLETGQTLIIVQTKNKIVAQALSQAAHVRIRKVN